VDSGDEHWRIYSKPSRMPRVGRYVPLVISVAATAMLVIASVIGLRNNNDFRCQTAAQAETWIFFGLFVTVLVAIPASLWVLFTRLVSLRVGLVGLALSLAPIAIAVWLLHHPHQERFWGCDPN
jgi:hypothetical protein